ncbi:MAG: XRE family transcriptional regulator, partial [Candidatus Obscuribacterales bacterium]|nr:XRE family transcriptional regulator [Candidatus Obscuribacterales bacterium]
MIRKSKDNKQIASQNKKPKKISPPVKTPVKTKKAQNSLPQRTESQIEIDSPISSVTNKRADGKFARPLRELLMIQISRVIDERGWTQKQAADFLGVTQPRISDLSRVRVDNFTIDLLVDWLGALGRQVTIEAKAANSIIPHLSQRFVANEDAVPFYTKAITLDPLCTDNYIKRGDAYFAQNKYDLAVGDFTRAMELAPNHPELRLRRADCYVKLAQYRAAIFDCDKVLSQVENGETWPES